MSIEFNAPVSVSPGRSDNVHVLVPNTAKPSAKGVESTGSDRQKVSAEVQSLPQTAETEDREQLQQAVQEINSVVQNLQRDLQFKVDTESGATVISVIDSETKEVIRQLPPEEVLERAKRMDAAARGEFPFDGLLLEMKI